MKKLTFSVFCVRCCLTTSLQNNFNAPWPSSLKVVEQEMMNTLLHKDTSIFVIFMMTVERTQCNHVAPKSPIGVQLDWHVHCWLPRSYSKWFTSSFLVLCALYGDFLHLSCFCTGVFFLHVFPLTYNLCLHSLHRLKRELNHLSIKRKSSMCHPCSK